jgi:hypothetical protein
MKKFIIVVNLVLFVFAGIGFAKTKPVTVKGYLLDNVCIRVNKANLPACAPAYKKECALDPACSVSGYAVYTDSGTLIPLTKTSNARAITFLKTPGTTLKVTVIGNMSGKYLEILSIKN